MFSNFIKYVGNNFGNLAGIGGEISTKIMNLINQKQYNAVLRNIKLEPNDYILEIIDTIEIQKDKSYCIISKNLQ